jgi:DNA-directed RNA polymerase II subunit RPB1
MNKECNAIQPLTIFRDSTHTMIKMEWSDKQIELYDADGILNIITKIVEDDLKIIGFSESYDPKNMIYTAFPLMLPLVKKNKDSKHDLTYKLCDIVKTNDLLKTKLAKNESNDNIAVWTKLLQYHVTTFIKNSVPDIPTSRLRNGKAISSLFDNKDDDLSF